PRLRQLGQGQPQGLGRADRKPFDRPGSAVRRGQGQERDRYADDDRRHGPALSRPCRRLRDHVVGQRLPAACPAHPRGRAAGVRLRHGQDTGVLPAGLFAFLRRRRARACGRRRSPRAAGHRQGPKAGRPGAAAGAGVGLQGVQARRGGLYPALRTRPAGQGRIELRGPQLRLHPPVRADQGRPQFRGEGRRRRPPAGQAAPLSPSRLCFGGHRTPYSGPKRNKPSRRWFWGEHAISNRLARRGPLTPQTYLDTAISALSSGGDYRSVLDELPVPIYTTDAEGSVTYWNRACVAFAGREPELGSDRWCVTWKIYTTTGEVMPHDQCPMATAIRERRIVRDVVAIAERPDGTRAAFRPYPTPLFDSAGKFIGAVNMLVDVTAEQSAALDE